jgi:hypothetical protein
MKRNNFSMREATGTGQSIPLDWELKVEVF